MIAALRALLLKQGHAWINRLCELQGWSDLREAAAREELEAAGDARLPDLVEAHRACMWRLLVASDLVPPYAGVKSAVRRGQIAELPSRAPRGLARDLLDKPKRRRARMPAQIDMFPER